MSDSPCRAPHPVPNPLLASSHPPAPHTPSPHPQVVSELVQSCRSHDFTDLIMVHEHRGEPDGLVVCHLPYGPTAYFGVFNAVLRHDIGDKKAVGTVSEAHPHLIFERFSSTLGVRVANILKYLFPPPKPDAKRVITFANQVGAERLE